MVRLGEAHLQPATACNSGHGTGWLKYKITEYFQVPTYLVLGKV